MEVMYSKLYDTYSKFKKGKDKELDQCNGEQEHKFVEYMSAAEGLVEHYDAENRKLSETVVELRRELVSMRTDKDQQISQLQEFVMEVIRKNEELKAEIVRLSNLQQECFHSSGNRIDQSEEQHANSIRPSASRAQLNETPMRMTRKRARQSAETDTSAQLNELPMRITRKRARQSAETDSSMSSPSVGHVELSPGRQSSSVRATRKVSTALATQPLPTCCGVNIGDGGACKCKFQQLVECIIDMKVTVVDQPEGSSLRAVHQSSGFTFSLTWVKQSDADSGEFLCRFPSLGTFATVAPWWMSETITFSMEMCPKFFEKVSQMIKHGC